MSRVPIAFTMLMFLQGQQQLVAQAQTCILNGQVGGWPGGLGNPFPENLIPVSIDPEVWAIAIDSIHPQCWAFSGYTAETVHPYPPSVQDTFRFEYSANPFPNQLLADRLALANSNELEGISDPILDGSEKWLLVARYGDVCHELGGLDQVSTRISIDNGTYWIGPDQNEDPFSVTATAEACEDWNSWQQAFAPFSPALNAWTGTAWTSSYFHVFDLFQGYRSVMPLYTNAEDYITAWGVGPPFYASHVLHEFILQSDDVHGGEYGWWLGRIFLTWHHILNGPVVIKDDLLIEKIKIIYDPAPILVLPNDLGRAQIFVFDNTGRLVQEAINNGENNIALVPQAPLGAYVVRIVPGSGASISKRFVKF